MIPAGIRLDLCKAMAKLPDEIAIPLLRSAREVNDTTFRDEIAEVPVSSLDVERRLYEAIRLQREQPSKATHKIWIRRLPTLVPTMICNKKRTATRVRLTNVSTRSASCPAQFPVLLWLPHEVLPRDDSYVRINATKYHDWKV